MSDGTDITDIDLNTDISDNSDKSLDINKNNKNITTIIEGILNDSRLTPTGNGNADADFVCVQPSSGQKWWASFILGFLFAIISSSAAYFVTSKITTSLGGLPLMYGPGPSFVGLLVHTIIFIIIIRIILW